MFTIARSFAGAHGPTLLHARGRLLVSWTASVNHNHSGNKSRKNGIMFESVWHAVLEGSALKQEPAQLLVAQKLVKLSAVGP